MTLSGICSEADQIDPLRDAVVEDLEVGRRESADRLPLSVTEHVDADRLDFRRNATFCVRTVTADAATTTATIAAGTSSIAPTRTAQSAR